MKVYIVRYYPWSSEAAEIQAVFASRETAEAWVESQSPAWVDGTYTGATQYHVEEWDVTASSPSEPTP